MGDDMLNRYRKKPVFEPECKTSLDPEKLLQINHKLSFKRVKELDDSVIIDTIKNIPIVQTNSPVHHKITEDSFKIAEAIFNLKSIINEHVESLLKEL